MNVQYVSCMNPTAGSFTINPRLQVLLVHLARRSIFHSVLGSINDVRQTDVDLCLHEADITHLKTGGESTQDLLRKKNPKTGCECVGGIT